MITKVIKQLQSPTSSRDASAPLSHTNLSGGIMYSTLLLSLLPPVDDADTAVVATNSVQYDLEAVYAGRRRAKGLPACFPAARMDSSLCL